jgi:hypothetical protein
MGTDRRRFTASSTFLDVSETDSCSQMRITSQPCSERMRAFRRSCYLVAWNLPLHQVSFAFGICPCLGQSCQKQPSTTTAIGSPGKRMSASQRKSGRSPECFRKRSPDRWRADRISRSGLVSRPRFETMVALAASGLASGAGLGPLGIPEGEKRGRAGETEVNM